jgi:hypothetical protein
VAGGLASGGVYTEVLLTGLSPGTKTLFGVVVGVPAPPPSLLSSLLTSLSSWLPWVSLSPPDGAATAAAAALSHLVVGGDVHRFELVVTAVGPDPFDPAAVDYTLLSRHRDPTRAYEAAAVTNAVPFVATDPRRSVLLGSAGVTAAFAPITSTEVAWKPSHRLFIASPSQLAHVSTHGGFALHFRAERIDTGLFARPDEPVTVCVFAYVDRGLYSSGGRVQWPPGVSPAASPYRGAPLLAGEVAACLAPDAMVAFGSADMMPGVHGFAAVLVDARKFVISRVATVVFTFNIAGQ